MDVFEAKQKERRQIEEWCAKHPNKIQRSEKPMWASDDFPIDASHTVTAQHRANAAKAVASIKSKQALSASHRRAS